MKTELDQDYWTNRYLNSQIGWDIGYVSTPLKVYFDQLTTKDIKILIPGAGNSYEAEYLHQLGFKHVFVADLSATPLENLKERVPNFPESHLIQGDFFEINQQYDLIIEQTFFCALNPQLRKNYVAKMHDLLKPSGKLVGLLFNIPLYQDHPPFGGNQQEYRLLFQDSFDFKYFDECYNSIKPRQGSELFISLHPKKA